MHTYFSKQPLLITCRCFSSEISTTPTTNHLVADDSAGKNHLRHNQQFEGIWIPNHFVASMRR